jgi:hypothetical protein
MRLIDEQFTPWYGSHQMTRHLRRNVCVLGSSRSAADDQNELGTIYQRPKASASGVLLLIEVDSVSLRFVFDR